MKKAITVPAAVMIAIAMHGTAMAGDADAGKRIFNRCKACHVADQEKNKLGPYLANVFGRKAGSVESFAKYSKPMKESGIVWDEANLDAYLENPRKVIPGGSMAFAGLKKKKDRDDVIAYLRQFSQ